ncbi:MAG: aquaporin family protein [Bacteroidetes bacterium]|nr:aquaporin family protein [Bacteroidota bacterium]
MNAAVAEFLGTFLLILLGNGVVANVLLNKTKGFDSGWLVITTGWGLAVFTGVVVAGPYSGAHLNPAVTLGLAIAQEFAWQDVPSFMIAQLAGAFLGATMVWILYMDHYKATDDSSKVLATFSTSPAINNPRNNVISEIIGTFVLVLVVFYISGAELLGTSTTPIGLGSVGALPVAFLVWCIGLGLGGPTGYAINPARDLGPRLAHWVLPISTKGTSDWSYAWVPVIGPLCGGALAALLYIIL